MGEVTKIEWTDHTFNPWIGCTKITNGCEGSACDFCYAETLVHRYGWAKWGAGEPRARTSEANWKKPLAWNRKAAKEGRRFRVFCASLADVFDAEVPQGWRGELFDVIKATPHLDWQLLTKRPQVALKFFTDRPDLQGLPNVWLGTTVESQKMADLRIPTLMSVPGVVKRFLSCEPLLGPIDLDETVRRARLAVSVASPVATASIDWVIAGGESGPKARAARPDWFRSLRDQCAATGVPFFFKQWGEWAPLDGTGLVSEQPDAKPKDDLYRIGKKRAGALLDGKLHREFPT